MPAIAIGSTAALIVTALLVALGLRDDPGSRAEQPGCPGHRSGPAQGAGMPNESLALLVRRRFGSCHGGPSQVAFYPGAESAPISASAPAYAREIFKVDWGRGQTLRYGADFYLPSGFHASLGGQVAVMRWDNYPLLGPSMDVGGVVIYGADSKARLVRGTLTDRSQAPLTDGLPLPENRWFRLDVVQHRASGGRRARSDVSLDGRRIASSHERISYTGSPAQRVRFGLVALDPHQTLPIALWFDQPSVSVVDR